MNRKINRANTETYVSSRTHVFHLFPVQHFVFEVYGLLNAIVIVFIDVVHMEFQTLQSPFHGSQYVGSDVWIRLIFVNSFHRIVGCKFPIDEHQYIIFRFLEFSIRHVGSGVLKGAPLCITVLIGP